MRNSIYEIRKVVFSKVFIVILIVDFLFGVIYSYRNSMENKRYVDMSQDSTYQSCLGEFSQEKLNVLQNYIESHWGIMEINGESKEKNIYNKYSDLHQKAKNILYVTEYRKKVSESAKRLSSKENGYYKRMNQKIQKMYEKDVALSIKEGTALNDLTGLFVVSAPIDVMSVILLILISFYIFLIEHKSGTYELVFSSRSGRKKTYFTKTLVAFLLSFLISLMQSVSETILVLFSCEPGELFEPVQSVERFAKSPYSINLLELIIIITLIRTVGFMVLESLFLFVSLFFKKSIIPFAIDAFLGLGLYWCVYWGSGTYVTYSGKLIREMVYYPITRYVTPIELIRYGQGYLWSFNTVNIFGFPVMEITVVLSTNIFILIMFVALGYNVYLKRWR